MPGIWRELKLADLFKKFNADLPRDTFFNVQQTTDWHFIDMFIQLLIFAIPLNFTM